MSRRVGTMRRKKGSKVDGWLILDKPAGITSTQAVNVVKRIFDAQKAGHAGTLDPLATGILPIALGEATKTVPYVMDGTEDLSLRPEVRRGARHRRCGRRGRRKPPTHRPTDDEIRAILAGQFIGEIDPGAAGLFRHQGRRASGPMTWPGRARQVELERPQGADPLHPPHGPARAPEPG